MTHDIYNQNVNIYLMKMTKLNFFKKVRDQIKPMDNKRNKMNQINPLKTRSQIKF